METLACYTGEHIINICQSKIVSDFAEKRLFNFVLQGQVLS